MLATGAVPGAGNNPDALRVVGSGSYVIEHNVNRLRLEDFAFSMTGILVEMTGILVDASVQNTVIVSRRSDVQDNGSGSLAGMRAVAATGSG